MTARILDGKALAARLRAALAVRVRALPYTPALAVVLVGDDPASAVYVRNKDRAATEAGLRARTIHLAADTDESDLLRILAGLNDDAGIDGILVQMPLPAPIRPDAVVDAIDPAKDVDGLTPTNIGRMVAGRKALIPCTPRGVMILLHEAETVLAGRRAVVIGRSPLVGRPVASLLVAANATVTILHSHSQDVRAECQRAEIVIAAAGKPGMVRGDWLSPGATLIDVGISRLPDGRLAGDAVYEECVAVAGAITPVPGGVGPMTIACLLDNTVLAAERRYADTGRQPRKSPGLF